MAIDLRRAREVAVEAARAAGDLLRADFQRPGGPRGAVDKADADTEAEQLIRERLLAEFSGWAFLGEETGRAAGAPGAPLWLVDPNDGTRDYLKGRRGSAVSIGLLVDRLPRLGVVFAFGYPDDRGDLFDWAEGCGPLRRNGTALAASRPGSLDADAVVLLASGGDHDVRSSLACLAPARMRTVPSIAHRLALAAAGEAAAAVSLHQPGAWDYGAGHALLRGAGGALVDESGREMAYAADGSSRCRHAFGGGVEIVRALSRVDWSAIGSGPRPPAGFPVRLSPGDSIADAGLVSRAQGCLLGQIAGDNLGALVEFQGAAEIAAAHGSGPRRLADGGRWNILAGQPTDDSEMALALARSVIAEGRFEPDAVLAAYREWRRSEPFDAGATVKAALSGRPDAESQANGALMRVSPLGIFACGRPATEVAELARRDARLTHPHPACADASAAYAVAIAHAVGTGDGASGAWQAASGWASAGGAHPLVKEALAAARDEAPVCDGPKQGFVRIALQNAFYALLHASSLEDGVVDTVRRGGDTDTNAAIAGALLGAVHGRETVPAQWRSMVLSCRPLAPFARVPRPHACWPTDALEIAERLLLAGGAR